MLTFVVTLVNAMSVARSVQLASGSGFELDSNTSQAEPKLDTMQGTPVEPVPLDQAVQKVTKLPAEIRMMLRQKHKTQVAAEQTQLFEQRTRILRGGKKQDPTQNPASYGNLDKVLQVINQLYEETNEEADITTQECTTFHDSTKGTIEGNTEDRVYLATTIAVAREDIAYCTANIQEAEKEIGGLQENLHEHEVQCAQTIHNLEEIEEITAKDFKVAQEIDAKIDCTTHGTPAMGHGATTPAPTLLVQDGAAGARAPAQDTAFVQCFVHGSGDKSTFKLRFNNGTVASFKSAAAVQAIQRAAQMLHSIKSKATPDGDRAPEDSQIPSGAPSMGDIDDQEQDTAWMDSVTLDEMPEKCGPPGEGVVDVGEKCDILKDAIAELVGEIQFVLHETQTRLSDETTRCTDVRNNLNGQISEWSSTLSQNQIGLAKATQSLNSNEDELRLRVEEFKDLKTALISTITECNEKFKKFHEEKCGLITIRLELYKIEGGNPYIVDCEVGPWVPQECSKSCGGGAQIQQREILADPVYGASCPPLQESTDCAMDECPVDCSYASDWSGWSECSKDCGGGVEQRFREIENQAAHGGIPCEATQESRVCNSQSCSRDCVLAHWTGWVSDEATMRPGCSKMCGGGMMQRFKHVAEEAINGGACADKHEENPDAEGGGHRVEKMSCNPQKCFPNLACASGSKLDVVMVMDGSGSVGSAGFEKTRKFGKDLLNRLELGDDASAAGVIMFTSWISIESSMSTDKAAVEKALTDMSWGRYSTATGAAIDTALNLLAQGGRQDAQSIIVVVTDGVPSNKDAALAAAARARTQENTRLVLVGVGPWVDQDFLHKMASFPTESNVLAMRDYDELDEKVGNMIADICPQLECKESGTAKFEDYIGCQDQTRGGKTCQEWGVTTPHYNYYNEHYYPGKGIGGGHNFCRNPDGDTTIWCITSDPNDVWDFCDPRDTNDIPTSGP